MFTMMREVGLRRSLTNEAPYLGLSFLIAELFYKFHSFMLECLAFLGTWFVLSALAACVAGMVRYFQPTES